MNEPDKRPGDTTGRTGENAPAAVLVAVVMYRSGDLTVDCLAALEPELAELEWGRVVVVDSASGDGSAEKVEAAIAERGWSGWAELVRQEENRGFAAGNNRALEYAIERDWSFDHVFFLNPDTEVRRGALGKLLDVLTAQPGAGIAGGRSEDPDGTPQECCFRFPNACDEFSCGLRLGLVDRLIAHRLCRVPFREQEHEIDWVSGAAMLVRREVLEEIGAFDEQFFLYFEETDWIFRARRAGWRTWHVPQSRIVHHVGISTGVTRSRGEIPRRPRYWFESRRRFFLRNRGFLGALLADTAAICGHSLYKLRRLVQRRLRPDPPHFLRDLIAHSVFLRGARLDPPRIPSLERTSRDARDTSPAPARAR